MQNWQSTENTRKAILDFHAENQDITLELKEYSEVEMFHALEMEWIDVAFLIHFPKVFQSDMEGMITEERKECVVIHQGNPLSQQEEIEIAQLKDTPFIMLRETRSEMGYNRIMTACLENGFTPNILMKVDSVAGALSCVDCNLGCIILTDALEPLAGKNVRFVPVKNSPPQHLWMVWKKGSENQACELFKQFMEQRLK